MKRELFRRSLAIAAIGFVWTLAGCGSGGSSTAVGSSAQVANVISGFENIDNIGADGGGGGDGDGGIGVGGSLGKIKGADVSVFLDTGETFGSAVIGSDGMVTARLGTGYAGSLMISMSSSGSAVYFDEAKRADVPTGTGVFLRAAVPRVTTKAIGVTPLTHAAVRNLETRVARGLDPGVHDPVAIAAANARVLEQINQLLPASNQLTDITILPTLVGTPAELDSLPLGSRGDYARALAAFALHAARFNPSLSAPGATFARNLADDLTDGRIDDRDIDGNPLAPDRSGLAYESSTLAAGLANELSNLRTVTATISDNGSAADDAFSVALDGNVICTTTIGAANACTLGQLAPGTYQLTITATIAPDNLGTYRITITSPNMTIDGATSASGTLREGESRTFSLVVR